MKFTDFINESAITIDDVALFKDAHLLDGLKDLEDVIVKYIKKNPQFVFDSDHEEESDDEVELSITDIYLSSLNKKSATVIAFANVKEDAPVNSKAAFKATLDLHKHDVVSVKNKVYAAGRSDGSFDKKDLDALEALKKKSQKL